MIEERRITKKKANKNNATASEEDLSVNIIQVYELIDTFHSYP